MYVYIYIYTYMYLCIRVKEMANLLLKVEGVTIMPLPTKADDGPPPMELRICMSSNL